MKEKNDPLLLCNQMCFPLYAASKEIVRRYTPILDVLGLTYTQYITMLVMWEHGSISVKEIGRLLYLDSGTLTPVLKKLESKGLLSRRRDETDERLLIVTLTNEGREMRKKALSVPAQMSLCVSRLTDIEKQELCALLKKLLSCCEE